MRVKKKKRKLRKPEYKFQLGQVVFVGSEPKGEQYHRIVARCIRDISKLYGGEKRYATGYTLEKNKGMGVTHWEPTLRALTKAERIGVPRE